jgi:hypothetical protein
MVYKVCQLSWQLSAQAAVTNSHRFHVTRTAITAVSWFPARGTLAARRPHPSDIIYEPVHIVTPIPCMRWSLQSNVVALKSPHKDPGRLNARPPSPLTD